MMRLLVTLLAVAAPAGAATAQDTCPSRPVKRLIGFPAGSTISSRA
jgi:hypothetical protein